ncbi:hypothetical protein ACQY1Q_07290 [Tenacibaculum sp. TC6]|uniref:hypothetical protein n=1 Tax=Tenacibaculum sp. TC6 TaxID=3423223 RepID=UPI003D36E9DD
MSKKPIKSNLFRFVTLRGPQTIEEEKLAIGFIKFPEESKAKNKALTAIDGVVEEQSRRQALTDAYNIDFTPLKTRLEVKNTYASIYSFSMWLAKNKTSLSYISIVDNFPSEIDVNAVKFNDLEFGLWNQLFYNTIHKESTKVRDVLIHLLIGFRFIKKFGVFEPSIVPKEGVPIFSAEEKKEFERRANASVIIPKEVILTANKSVVNDSVVLSSGVSAYLKNSLLANQAQDRLVQYRASLKELETAEMSYNKTEQIRYEEALKVYDSAVDELKKAAIPTIQRIVDVKTAMFREIEVFPKIDFPKFEFEKAPEIVRTTEGDVQLYTQETVNLLNTEEFKGLSTFSEVNTLLKQKIKEEQQNIITNVPEGTKDVQIQGENISFEIHNKVPLYSYYGMLNRYINWPIKPIDYSVQIILRVEKATNLAVTDATYSLSDTAGVEVYSGTEVRSKASDFDSRDLVVTFFPARMVFARGVYKMNARFTLSNGAVLTFEEDIFVDGNSKEIEGQCKQVISVDGGDVVVPVESDGNLYGVTQLGIADFRRVEQEICCYVPGEVSHIENIMAREFKERSTRNLTSYEQTTEQSSEKEVENLTDTTTSERNEMQSEASSIVNKDATTSFGANASVSGEIWGQKYSAGTNYNTSNSSSVSNSNLQAQTYAQEVAERALERVVQKVSYKRTSRVLREHEENNTHGFDNRKGDKHVTGVYRWVDKIYKNKLVNYGKRLMYEFALPEPAKFYIDAFLNKKSSVKESALIAPIKPEHLKDLNTPRFDEFGRRIGSGILSAADINEGNYQILAGLYNAEVKAYPETKSVGKSFSFTVVETSEHHQWDEVSAGASEIKIPDGYEAKFYKVGVSHQGIHNEVGVIQVNLAGMNCVLKNNEVEGNFASGLTSQVAASYSQIGRHSGNIGIQIWCSPTEEGIEQWQNEAYNAIMDAYNKRLQEYNEFMQGQQIDEAGVEKNKEFASQLNRAIEKRELKRIAIDLMTKPFGVETKGDHYQEGSNTELVADRKSLQVHSEVVKFFEQAFDWEIMAYIFYPYFYGKKEKWEDSFNYLDGNDPIFKAFLQSAMARATVPVRPGFEDAINWYMKTGEIWNGKGMVTDMDDELYLSIAEEMQTIQGEVEGTWETRVPTSLTVLQADSVALNEGGLPCNTGCEGEGLFELSTDKIGDPLSGVDYDIVGQTNTVA